MNAFDAFGWGLVSCSHDLPSDEACLIVLGFEVCTHARGTMLHDVIYTGYVVIHAVPDAS